VSATRCSARALHELMTDYAQALVGFVMQSTACNAMHSLEQRLARWLLMAQDRMGADKFPLTQEFVAMMLGAAATDSIDHRGHAAEGGLDRIQARDCHDPLIARKLRPRRASATERQQRCCKPSRRIGRLNNVRVAIVAIDRQRESGGGISTCHA